MGSVVIEAMGEGVGERLESRGRKASRLSSVERTSVGREPSHITSDGSCLHFGLRPPLWAAARRDRPALRWRDLTPDSPYERGHLMGDFGHDDGELLACRAEPPITGARTDLAPSR